jgi:hypothetical protein
VRLEAERGIPGWGDDTAGIVVAALGGQGGGESGLRYGSVDCSETRGWWSGAETAGRATVTG